MGLSESGTAPLPNGLHRVVTPPGPGEGSTRRQAGTGGVFENDQADSKPSKDSHQKEEENRTNEGGDHVADEAGSDADVEHPKEPSADEGSEDADEDCADKTNADPLNKRIGQEAGDSANDDPKDNLFYGHLFLRLPWVL